MNFRLLNVLIKHCYAISNMPDLRMADTLGAPCAVDSVIKEQVVRKINEEETGRKWCVYWMSARGIVSFVAKDSHVGELTT